jgi:hypothetical protein
LERVLRLFRSCPGKYKPIVSPVLTHMNCVVTLERIKLRSKLRGETTMTFDTNFIKIEFVVGTKCYLYLPHKNISNCESKIGVVIKRFGGDD